MANFQCTLQGSTPEYGALNFSNNAPSWEDLQRMAEQQAKETNWSRPDLEQARLCGMLSDINAVCLRTGSNEKYGYNALLHRLVTCGSTNAPISLDPLYGPDGSATS